MTRSELHIEELTGERLERNSAHRAISIKRTRDEAATEVRLTDKEDAATLNLFYEGEATGTPRMALGYSYPQLVALGFTIAEFGLRAWEEWNERYAAEHNVPDGPEPSEQVTEEI